MAAMIVMVSNVAISGDALKIIDIDNSGTISTTEAASMPSLVKQWDTLDSGANGLNYGNWNAPHQQVRSVFIFFKLS